MSVIAYLKSKLQKIRHERENKTELGDDVCTDRYLKSLRREARLFEEKKEKEYLKQKLAKLKMQESRRNMWGIKSAAEKRKDLLDKQKYNLMQNKNYKLIRPAHQSSQGFIKKSNNL